MEQVNQIFRGKTIIVSFTDVQHIELLDEEDDVTGIFVITKHTKMNIENDTWENPIYLIDDEAKKFIDSWTKYKEEIENKLQQSNN